ncbi:MAG TPA: hypothetical protein EYF97_02155 [Gammaproteobacteria bacterium]|jgi:hypothetical protein|nr:hypothetical protein [Gammaproteobacteria bacterium]HIK72058.1 hypothetical protein [Gammaproteobacteria bacterium]
MKNEEFIEQVFHLVFGELYKKKEMTLFPIQEMFTKEELIEELGSIMALPPEATYETSVQEMLDDNY